MRSPTLYLAAASVLLTAAISAPASAQAPKDQVPATYQVGVARVDVTPDYPVRLNGFGFRREESEGVTQRIWAKALAFGQGEQTAVLITLDSLGVRLTMVDEVARRLKDKTGLPRERFALTFSHSHTTPKVNGAADNIFSTPIPPPHQEHIDRYTKELTDQLEQVALAALADRREARLEWSVGEVKFAKNRRTAGGPVDHDLPLLAVRDLDGGLRAVYVSYACHCVTLSNNKISGDWAGYAQELIERKFPGAVALVSIGAGSDQNPVSGVVGDKVDVAIAQGAEIADEAARLLAAPLRPLDGPITARLQLIDLPLKDPPSREALQEMIAGGGPRGYNATTQLARLDRDEPLLTRIRYPIQTWSFGDRLSMVFLAGEVCVDYAHRLKRELDSRRLWIHGYANDFCAYIPSERLLREGGYGGGSEIPYFALPNTFQPGLEDKIVAEVRRQLPDLVVAAGTQGVPPQTPDESLQSLRTHDRLRIELVASEPLVADPVAIDFGPDGRMWVVEMPDYSRGTEETFEPRGHVKFLVDDDQDGRFDRSEIFVRGLRFPTDVKVWRDGILICDAPDIVWARDEDGDGRLDSTRTLFTGFATHNPHARVNSLRWGLDNWLHGSGGLFGGRIQTPEGAEVDVSARDFRCRPDTGQIQPASGRTQQGRVRDDWGNWFGCTNGTLLQHYPLQDHYLARNPHAVPPAGAVFVPDYPDANRLYPRGELVRFKLSGPAGRPTSACGLGIYRDQWLGDDFQGDAFVCEPVNQLVHRLRLSPRGATFSGRRADEEQASEFLTSTDRWFRPVQVRTGPDGGLYVVDMYRYVIEHPRWIPPETLAELDPLAGQGRGRIYRISHRERPPREPLALDRLSTQDLVAQLDHPNGTRRDLVHQLLLWRADRTAAEALWNVFRRGRHPAARLQALAVLDGLDAVDENQLREALRDPHPEVRRHAIRISESRLARSPELLQAALSSLDHPAAAVRMQLAWSLGELPAQAADQAADQAAAQTLARLLLANQDDAYQVAAVFSSLNDRNVEAVLRAATESTQPICGEAMLGRLITTALRLGDAEVRGRVVAAILDDVTGDAEPRERFPGRTGESRRVLLHTALEALSWEQLTGSLPAATRQRLSAIWEQAREVAGQEGGDERRRRDAIGLLGFGSDQDRRFVAGLLDARQPIGLQLAAVEALACRPDATAPALLLAGWNAAGPTLRGRIIDALLSRRAWAESLLTQLEAQRLRGGDLSLDQQNRLRSVVSQPLQARVETALRLASGSQRQAVVDQFASADQLNGNVSSGEKLFADRCANCHRLGGKGHAVGPDLAALSSPTPSFLRIATLDPSREVDGRYVNYVASTTDGKILSGVLLEETASSITLVEQAGKRHVVVRGELEELRSTGKSLMPDGLEKDLTPQQLADLLAYVRHQGPARQQAPRPKSFPGNQPAEVLAEAGGQLTLSASRAAIFGDQIRYEPPLRNIGYWHGTQDHVAWQIRLDAAGSYDVWLEWSCADSSAGNSYLVEGPGFSLPGVVEGTGGWDRFRRVKLSQEVRLEAGSQSIRVRPKGPLIRPALFDLRAVYLVPRGQTPRTAGADATGSE